VAPLVQELAAAAGAHADARAMPVAPPAERADLVAVLGGLPRAERRALLAARVREHAARVLGLGSADRVEPDLPFGAMGLDSLMAVELRNRLRVELGRALPMTIAFDHPTVDALTDHLLEHVLDLAPPGLVHGDAARSPSVLDAVEVLTDRQVEELLANRLR